MQLINNLNTCRKLKTITIAMDSENERGLVSLVDYQLTNDEQQHCDETIAEFKADFAELFPVQEVPTVKVMAIRRDQDA